MLGCSERTVREYCKAGKIPEAIRTRGGQWRIRRPFSGKTRLLFAKIRGDWPFDGSSEKEDELNPEFAEWLVEAQLYEKKLGEYFPEPDLADLEPSKRAAAAQIQCLIWQRLQNGKPLSDLILLGCVYQFWLKNQCCPTVSQIAELMRISRSAFYRKGHTFDEVQRYYHQVCEPIRIEFPGQDRANFGNSGHGSQTED